MSTNNPINVGETIPPKIPPVATMAYDGPNLCGAKRLTGNDINVTNVMALKNSPDANAIVIMPLSADSDAKNRLTAAMMAAKPITVFSLPKKNLPTMYEPPIDPTKKAKPVTLHNR